MGKFIPPGLDRKQEKTFHQPSSEIAKPSWTLERNGPPSAVAVWSGSGASSGDDVTHHCLGDGRESHPEWCATHVGWLAGSEDDDDDEDDDNSNDNDDGGM